MNIELKKIKIRDIVKGYNDDKTTNHVSGYDGKLDIRPAYQREFVYKDEQRNAVIDTIQKNFPLNVMYWIHDGNNSYEVLDGQQRTISICEYFKGLFHIKDNDENEIYFQTLTITEQNQILDYELMIYFCEGTDKEKLDWFKIINIAGEKLTEQELRNAIYTGPWLSDAKFKFSMTGCVAYNKGGDFLNGKAIRQEYLETVLKWISNNNITQYMAKHQHDKDADALWQYFQQVINWVEQLFPAHNKYKKEMKGIEWGFFFNKYKNNTFNSNDIQKKLQIMMLDEEVENKKGIFCYLIDNNEKHLNLRKFSDSLRRQAFEKQKDKQTHKATCPKCPTTKKLFNIEEMEADHINPWHLGGKTTLDNCQMLCLNCNRIKSGK